jgi:hypothetical protein
MRLLVLDGVPHVGLDVVYEQMSVYPDVTIGLSS